MKQKENKTLSTIKEKKESFKKHMDKNIEKSKVSIKQEVNDFRNMHNDIVDLYHKQHEERKELLNKHNKVYLYIYILFRIQILLLMILEISKKI